jgi:hypothetical protein
MGAPVPNPRLEPERKGVRALPNRMLVLAAVLAFAAFAVAAAQNGTSMGGHTVSVSITNTTAHQTFSAPVVVAHSRAYQPFALGKPLDSELVPVAADGQAGDFETVAKMEPSILDYAIAKAPLAPGQSVTLQVRVDDAHSLLSAFGMLLMTQDVVFYYGEDLAMATSASGSSMVAGSDVMKPSSSMTSSQTMGSSGTTDSSDSMGSSGSMGSSDSMGSSKGMVSSAAMDSSSNGMSGNGMGVDLYDGSVRVLDAGHVVNLHKGFTAAGDAYGWKDPLATVAITTP